MRHFMTRLDGRWVLITGAGHGLGRAMAAAFADVGSRIIVTDQDPDGVESTTRWLNRRGNPAVGIEMDVTCSESISRARQEVMSQIGKIDVLVNNAGTVRGGLFTDVPLEEHLTTLDVNTQGPIRVTHAFLPDLLASPVAHLVNIISAAALIGLPGASTYAASKWALLGFSESLREELRQNGHHHAGITAVCPSYISTGLFSGVRPPRLTRMLTPAAVARQVVRAVLTRRSHLMLPRTVGLIPLSRSLLPTRWSQRLGDWTGIHASMTDWRGHKTGRAGLPGEHSDQPPPFDDKAPATSPADESETATAIGS
ncbi:MAG TPA: short-chain dehydrogenase [Planctomycetaceae bacterium]|nr:short-chain dehydrogenase [Planctomycetaceae bacterium]HCK51891.1 short-chain dehydrogenase [Planctomycetaceae bacterium]